MPITRLDGKRKMSQNRNAQDRAGVATNLALSERAADRAVAELIPKSILHVASECVGARLLTTTKPLDALGRYYGTATSRRGGGTKHA
jgi:hypothetical protein